MKKSLLLLISVSLLLCGCGKEEHVHQDFTSIPKLPTCTETGILSHECECGYVYEEAIPALGHELTAIREVPATCVLSGLSEGQICSRCDTTLIFQREVLPLGHSFVDGKCTTCGISNAFWDGTANVTWYNEIRTTFTLSTASELAGLQKLVSEGKTFEGMTIKLGSDIGFNDSSAELWNLIPPDTNWLPIGSEEAPFKGTFLGEGHTLHGLYSTHGSIFGYVESGTISDFTIQNSFLTGEDLVAPIGKTKNTKIGYLVNESCTVIGTNKYTAGIVAYHDRGTISHAENKASVHGWYSVGGIAGYSSGTIENSSSILPTADDIYCGSIVGYLYYGQVNSCTGENQIGHRQ